MTTVQLPRTAAAPDPLADYRSELSRLGTDLARKRRAAREAGVRSGELARAAYRAGLSQVEIAKLLGVARSSVIEWIHSPKT